MSPTRQLPYAILALTIALPAQRPDPVALPRLMQLGPMPEGGAVMILTKDGRLAKPHGQAEAPESVLLRIDRDTPMAGVTKLLETLRAKGTHRVQFAAELPNGDPGCFTLALPEGEATITTVALRLHRGRSGVPPTSVIPVLRRMNRCPLDEGFVVAIDTPDDLGFEAALRVLAAAQTAGVEQAVLRTNGEKGGQRPNEVSGGLGALAGALGGSKVAAGDYDAPAIDLGPRPFIAFAPRVVRQDKPAVQAQAVGCLTRARPGREDGLGGGAGGRYGGRGGGKGIAMARFGEAPSGTRSWLLQQQSADGSLPDAAGNADLEGTALLMLSLLGDGNTLRGGPFTEPLSRGIGWLLDQQDDDGRFGQRGPDEVRLHALATYVMAEAFGLSIAWPLRPALQDGLAWLGAHRQADGGFGDGTTSDCMSTATALMALASAEFFAQEPPARPAEVIAWFDTQPAADKLTTAETAATLFCRFFAGQEPKSTPSMVAAAKLLGAKARTDEPWEAYWTSYALFQVGGGDWKAWSKRLQGIADARLTDGEFAGSWEPAGGHSRIVTGALRLLSLQAYYRYTKLVR